MSYLANQQVLILKEGSNRNRGKDAQRSNMSAARIVSEVVKTTLGPRGMDKMLVDSLGDVTVTSDGATVLDELDVQHPAAKMLVEIAKTQDDEVGDGTTSVVVLAGELLKRAELLLDKGLHPTVINAGFKKAAEKAREILNELGKPVDLKDTETLRKIAVTAMRGKSLGGATEHFANIAVEAVNHVVEKIKKSGANVVLCQKGIDEVAQSFMAKNGILAARRIKKSDIEKLSRATGARIITNLEDIRSADLGFAGLVEERKVGDDKMVFIEDSKDPKSVSILIRAGLERLVDEAERALKDALSVIIDVVKKNKIVAGGGAIEIELAKR